MDDQVKVAHIQGRYKFITAVIVAIITGLFSISSVGYINKLIDNIDVLNSEKDLLSNQIIELKQQINDKESSYSDLQDRYTSLEKKYKSLLDNNKDINTETLQVPETNIQQETVD